MATINQITTELENQDMIYDIFANRMSLPNKPNSSQISGLCPFHQDSNPSFSVNVKNGLFYCFGCHEHGNIYQFVSKIDGISLTDAIRKLAEMVGMTYESSHPFVVSDEEQSIINNAEQVITWMHENLMNDEGALEYLQKKRGMTPDDVAKTEIGYVAPNQLDPNDPRILQLGLSKNNYLLCDDAIVYPIRTITEMQNLPNGTVTGWSVKPIDKSKHNSFSPYITYPSGNKIGFYQGQFNPAKGVFLTEGAADAQALHQIGYHGALSGLGAVLSQDRIQELFIFMLNHKVPLYISLDNDKPGHDATRRIIKKLSDINADIDIRALHIEKDLDEYIVAHEEGKLKDLIADCQPYYYELAEKTDFRDGEQVKLLAHIGSMAYESNALLQEKDFEKRSQGLHFDEILDLNGERTPLRNLNKTRQNFLKSPQGQRIETYVLRYYYEFDREKYEEIIANLHPNQKVINNAMAMKESKLKSKFSAEKLLGRLNQGVI